MIPKLIINKNNKRNHFNELLEVAYNKLNINKKYNNKNNYIINNNINNFYHEIFYFYKKKETNNLATKIYTIFPNINFEFRQIPRLSFSNTNLNKFLINSKFKLPDIESERKEYNKNELKSGFFTMSQNHRLIALKDDINEYGDISKSQSLKEIIFGIWINLNNEKPTHNNEDLEFLFNKYKKYIFKECFRFVQLSNYIETIYSPSPEENIFLLVIFYKGIQCHYEVKMNEKPNKNIYDKNEFLMNNNNFWLISKCKYEIDEHKKKIPFDFDIKIEINNGTLFTMSDYLNKKIEKNNIINIKEKNNELNKTNKNLDNNDNNNNIINDIDNINYENLKIMEENNKNNILNNNTFGNCEIYECEEDSINREYNYPLIIPNINNNNINNNILKKNQNKNEHYKKQPHEISRASTNTHSNKPSLSSSKNSGKHNNSNLENNNQINEEENNINESFELINQYTSIIMKNGESIKKLQNQVNQLEKNIIAILNKLENEKNEKHISNNKKDEININNISNNKDNLNNNNDISKIGDISINVPKIIYKELSMTNDDL